MAFFNEFPHTRFYDADLGWIIKKMGMLLTDYASITEWMTIHKDEYAELEDKVNGLINNLVDVIVPWDSSKEYDVFSIVEYQGTNYIAVQDVPIGTMITNTDYWQPANTVIDQINAMSIVVSKLQEKALTVDPDDYGGTDSQRIQAAIDEIGDTDSGVIILRRMYNLDANVTFKTHSLRRTLRVIGLSNNAGFNMDEYHFNGDAAAAGGIFFDNVYFTGSSDKIFNIGANLIRLEFTNCFFYQNNDIFSGEYAQQIRLVNCRFSYCHTIFVTTGDYGCLACSVISCDIEDCHMLYDNVSGGIDSSFTIEDSCFESFDDVLIKYETAANQP
ncbi:MAG: hypothetical protein IKG04_01445, partial [Exiguobacterium sp.]|nr:hypothetical protein [Exiguobacterium sp.]